MARGSASAQALAEGLTGSIADVKHVVILMQENRSFDHYFGTLSGVRGFGDKQILTYQNGNKIFQQPDTARTDLGYLLPHNLTDQVDGDLDHSWEGDHEAWNGGAWNNWVPWDATLTGGKYAFSVYGPDGFLTSFAGQVVSAGQNAGPVPVVTASLSSSPATTVELMLANQGQEKIVYTLTPNDYEGRTQTVAVTLGSPKTVSWPTSQYGYYDVVITTNTGDGFRRRYAGRIA